MHNIQLKFIAFSFWKNSFIVHVFFVLIFIEVQLIYNIVNATGVHQSFQILFWYKSLKSIEQSSLCYAVGPYQLSILYLIVYVCQSQSLSLHPPCPFPPVTINLFSVYVTRINNFICFFFSMRTGVRHSPLGAARITLGRSTTCARRKQRENLCSSWAQVNPKYEVVHARVLGRTGGGV